MEWGYKERREVSRTRGYKKVENAIVRSVLAFFRGAFFLFKSVFLFVFRLGGRRLTVMVVPHSQKSTFNFQTTIFSLVFTFLIITALVSSFIYFSISTIAQAKKLQILKEETLKTQANLDGLKNETDHLIKNAKDFQNTLSTTLTSLGFKSVIQNDEGQEGAGDLKQIFNFHESGNAYTKEVGQLRLFSDYLQAAIKPVEEMGKMLDLQATFFSDIPSLNPIRTTSVIPHVSMTFGQNRHPITGQWYVHTGIDLSTYRQGDPIIATANGQVVAVEYDLGWGNYIIVRHKHGFYTRYAHLQSHRVSRGDYVHQGDVIGYLGNTGISTGAHIHYEVHIGSDVVDPAKYLSLKHNKKNK